MEKEAMQLGGGGGGAGEMALSAVVDVDLWNEIITIIIMYKYKKQLKKLKK